jgi:hypothetical protein
MADDGEGDGGEEAAAHSMAHGHGMGARCHSEPAVEN